jgi:hypothetical protein
MNVSFETVSGLVFGIEYFEEDEELDMPFGIWIHLGLIRICLTKIRDE